MSISSKISEAIAKAFTPVSYELPSRVRPTIERPEFGWQELVKDGNVIYSRIVNFSGGWIPVAVMAVSASMLIGSMLMVIHASHQNGGVASAEPVNVRQRIDDIAIGQAAIPRTAFGNPNVPKIDDIATYVKGTIDGLNNSGRMPYPCQQTGSIKKPWIDPSTSDVVLQCNSVGGKQPHVWLMTAVTDGNVHPFLGAFVKEDGKWVFRTVGFAHLTGYGHIPTNYVANTLRADFKDADSPLDANFGVDPALKKQFDALNANLTKKLPPCREDLMGSKIHDRPCV